ncbi:hypothetical protein EUBDOL_00374 [Amedibacillus dolichus DSM 3991]|uniref:Uncharacterized protein n=1 Tax=Amedibacillus dolichus DSM 3991 TaxID=428127 RepID=A8R8Q0_9FIRM|nr:hypothetical protein EUBDOL_00374 [Amedibacillus dolichus DSM 3991]
MSYKFFHVYPPVVLCLAEPPEDAILLLISKKFAKGCIALSFAEGLKNIR